MTADKQTPEALRVNETSRVRDAWHTLNDHMQTVKESLTAADGMPSEGQAAEVARASELLIRAIHNGRDARYWRTIDGGATHGEALAAQEGGKS